MNGDSAFQTQPTYVVQKTSNRRRLVVVFVVVFLLIIAALGALYLLGSSARHTPTQPTNPIPTQIAATPTPASQSAQLSPTVAATVSPTAAATNLTISVLNGSGTVGAAGGVASTLKSAGFSNVTTGNASVYTYTGLTIHAKNKDDIASVEKALEDANPNAKITTGVDPTISTDVEVIVGK